MLKAFSMEKWSQKIPRPPRKQNFATCRFTLVLTDLKISEGFWRFGRDEFRLSMPLEILTEGPSITSKFGSLSMVHCKTFSIPEPGCAPPEVRKFCFLQQPAFIFSLVPFLLPANRTNLEAKISAKFRDRQIKKNAEQV